MSPDKRTAAPPAPLEGRRTSALAAYRNLAPSDRRRVGGCVAYLALVTLVFCRPLGALASYAARHDLHSYIVLAPFVTAYLIFLRRRQQISYRSSFGWALVAAAAGFAAGLASFHWSAELSRNDGLALMAVAIVSLVVAGGFLFLGAEWMRANAFAAAFLLFLIPLPDRAVNWLENASMLASADAAAFNFRIWGVTVVRTGTVFELPGITLQVAQECSGINSSWALFIMSVLTSHLFLRTGWRRLIVVAFVIPLGILRNGFRILVIGWLCVNVGPEMIDSPIHHQGGPIFFALSVLPFFALLWWLWHQEGRSRLLSRSAREKV